MINLVNSIWIMDHQIEEDSTRTKIQKLVQTKLVVVWQQQRTPSIPLRVKSWRRYLQFMPNDQDLYLTNSGKDPISRQTMWSMLRQIQLLRRDHII